MGKKKRNWHNPQALRAMRGMALPYCFTLFERHRFILSSDSCLWHFKETLQNGSFCRYSLSGKCRKISSPPVRDHLECGSANLYAKIMYQPHEATCRVFIEDIVTSRRSRHIGSWMMNNFIEFLREWDSFFMVEEVCGELSPVDESDPVNRLRRDTFFREFGFGFVEEDTGMDRSKYIKADLWALHIKPLPDIQLIDMERVFSLVVAAVTAGLS